MDVSERFSQSEEYEFLQPYLDEDGLVAGYRIQGLLSRSPWRHATYEASTPDGRRVALKLLLHSGHSRREAKRYQQRVRARASINHAHLLPIFDWGRLGDRYYIAMGLCQAPTLAELVKAGPLETKVCFPLLRQLADALETAHQSGVIHRDLASENVLIAPVGGGGVLLGDFGAANPERAGGALDLAEPVFYISPERVREEALTPASNVYSLACILFECLTGRPPYTFDLPGMVAYAHVAEPPPRPSERRAELPVAIDDLMAVAMAKDPNERPQSPRRLVAAAAAALGLDGPSPVRKGASQEGGPGRPSVTAVRDEGVLPPSVTATTGRLAMRRPSGPGKAARPRNALAFAVAVVMAGSGALGFTVGRSSEDEGGMRPSPVVDSARRGTQSERIAGLGATEVALERLDARRASARRRLAKARTTRAQAAEAVSLGAEYRSAAQAVPLEFPETARVAAILNEAAQAYGRLAAAALSGNRPAYATASRAVSRAEEGLQQAIVRLNQARR